jgi:rhomboid family GlyGly-CTERM serine protease
LKSGGKLWLALCAWLALFSLIGWWVPAALWDWQPAVATTQPWRWWTAAFVHWSPLHLTANLVGLAVVAALGRVAAVPAVVTLAWLASWPLLHLSLWFKPELAHYGGLSGVLHGGVMAAAMYVVWAERGRRRQIAWAIIAGLTTKLLLEEPWSNTVANHSTLDIAVAPIAHFSGVAWAAVCTALALARGPEHVAVPAAANDPLEHRMDPKAIDPETT